MQQVSTSCAELGTSQPSTDRRGSSLPNGAIQTAGHIASGDWTVNQTPGTCRARRKNVLISPPDKLGPLMTSIGSKFNSRLNLLLSYQAHGNLGHIYKNYTIDVIRNSYTWHCVWLVQWSLWLFIVDGGSTCPFIVTTCYHVKMIPVNTSVTPATYGNAKLLISDNRKWESEMITRCLWKDMFYFMRNGKSGHYCFHQSNIFISLTYFSYTIS